MDAEEYRKRGKEVVDWIANYLTTIRQRRVFPDVKPGYMRVLLPEVAPEQGEPWENIFSDFESIVLPGVTHWQSPYMHAYFPALNSYPSLLGDMLSDAINCLGFTWASSPACTELETLVMDWLGQMIGLPSEFLHSNTDTAGGGCIQTTASEATFVSLLAARTEAIRRCQSMPDMAHLSPAEINGRLVAYCSEQAHSSVEKACLIALVKLQLLPSDSTLSLRGDTLREAVQRDREAGLIPFYLCATLGTTGACAFDKLSELGPICEQEYIWLHIDAAYAGTAFICPEYRHLMAGVEYAQSFAFNPSKWMMVHFDCTAMWVKSSAPLHRTFNVQPLYLKHENSGAAIDYMHWQVPLSKRFRALKLWTVIRAYGISGLQEHVRKGVRLAQLFEELVLQDERFEVPAKRWLGMVVFRLQGENEMTESLLKKLNSSGQLHCVPACIHGKYIIRFTVTSPQTTEVDIRRDWSIIQSTASTLLCEASPPESDVCPPEAITHSARPTLRQLQRSRFGLSLMLSNVPQSPRFINGSYVAIFDHQQPEVILGLARELSNRRMDQNPFLMIQPRRKLKEKQLSLPCVIRPRFTPKQGSFDSKVEEIFESSLEQDESAELTEKKTAGYNGHVNSEPELASCPHCGSIIKSKNDII